MTFEHRDMTDAELNGIVGGMSWGAAGAVSKLRRGRSTAADAPVPAFRGTVAAGTPPAAGPAPKAPRCTGPWCSA